MSVLVGKQAPDFDVPAVLGTGEIVDSFKLSEAIKGKYGGVLLPAGLHFRLPFGADRSGPPHGRFQGA